MKMLMKEMVGVSKNKDIFLVELKPRESEDKQIRVIVYGDSIDGVDTMYMPDGLYISSNSESFYDEVKENAKLVNLKEWGIKGATVGKYMEDALTSGYDGDAYIAVSISNDEVMNWIRNYMSATAYDFCTCCFVLEN